MSKFQQMYISLTKAYCVKTVFEKQLTIIFLKNGRNNIFYVGSCFQQALKDLHSVKDMEGNFNQNMKSHIWIVDFRLPNTRGMRK